MAEANPVRLQMERHKGKLVDIIDSEYGLFNTLLKNRVLSDGEIGRIKVKSSRYKKNEMLLDYISHTRKHEDFMAALRESSQTHIVNWIIADGKYTDEMGLDWPLTVRETNILNDNQAELVEILDTCDLLNRLYSTKVINMRHKEFIESKTTNHDKNEALLEIVRRLSRKGYYIFINCLRESKQGHVADIFEFGGAIVPVHATLQTDNLDEAETQIVNRMADEICSNTTSMGHANRLLAALQLKVMAVKRGESIVLYVKCCKEEEFDNLRKVVENMELKEALEKLFILLLQNTTIKVLVVKIFETDLVKAKETFALHMAEQKAATVEMASTGNEAMKRLRALSECCICLTTYTDPRMLPCFHTACLKCIEDIQLKNEKKPGDVLPCPLCRNEFQIPPDGMKGLKRNFFIESLMEVTNTFNIENKSRPCAMCRMIEKVNDVAQATMRCWNCCENYCLQCSKIHKTLKATKDHKIVELNIDFKEEEIKNICPIRKCVKHSDKVLDIYCSDCKAVVCVSCFVEDHQTHKCKDVTTVDTEFRHRIKKSFTEMTDHKEDIWSRKSDLERKKRDFLAKVVETESVIKKKNQQLKALIDQHTEEVLNELSLLKQHREKKMVAEIEEIERKLAVHESFLTYCTELKSKGSPSEVCGSADSLIERANTLKKENDEYLRAPSEPFDFEFIAIDHNALQNAGNIIGKLSDSTKESNRCAVVIADDEATIIMSLNRPEDVTTLEPLPDNYQFGPAAAAAVYGNLIFVCGMGNKNEDIWRLDETSSEWCKCASLIQGRQCHSVAFVDHVLYICGGWLGSLGKALDDVETYNIYENKCSKVGKLVCAVDSSGNCVPFQTSLYIFGGFDADGGKVSIVQVYDTKLNTCTLLTQQMPRACVWLRGELWKNSVIILGYDGSFIYDIEAQTWKVRDRFKLENPYSGVIVNDGKLFVIGCGAKKDDVRWIPIANFLNDELTEWRHYAKLPDNYFKKPFAFGKLVYPL